MGASARPSGGLFGRDADLERIGALLAGARGGQSGVLALRGDPGIGKTALLSEAQALGGRDVTVLATTGVEGESEIPYAALLTLLTPALAHLDTLPDLQRNALAGVLALGPPTGADQLTVGTAVLALLDAAAVERPLLAMVDDAHWLDSASAGTVLFVARRLAAERVVLLLGIRDPEGFALDTSGIDELTLPGLDRSASRRLLARAGGEAPPAAVVDGLLAATAGNPLALLELPAAIPASQLAGAEPLDDPLTISSRLQEAFLRRAEALPHDTRAALLLAAAASNRRAESVALAGPAMGTDLGALEQAEGAGLIELAGDVLRFKHPLMRAAVYHGAAGADRRRAHRALADTEPSGLRRAWHLANAALGPDEDTAAELEAAAENARSRAGQGAAAAAQERAAQLTPAGPLQAARLVRAAEQRLLSGSAERAVELANDALALDPSAGIRARAEQVLSRLELLRGSLEAAHDRGVRAAELVQRDDPDAAVAMLLEAGLPGFMSGRISVAVETMGRAYELSRDRPMSVRTAPTVLYGAALTIAGRFEEGRPLLDRWLEVHVPEQMLVSPPELIGATQSLTWIEAYDGCLSICERVIELARAVGAAGPLQLTLAQRAEVRYRLGDWGGARSDASESIRLAEATGQPVQASFPTVVIARLETASGMTEEARARTGPLDALAEAAGMGSMTAYIAGIDCLGHLGASELAEAVDRGRRVREVVLGFGMLDPSVLQWRADFIEALVKTAQVDEARAELEEFAQQAARTQRPWVCAAVARCRGLLESDEAIDGAFGEAMAWHARGADPFERARTQLSWGERLRRARRPGEAREPLRDALETFERLGARPWARRARGELRASGGALPPTQRSASQDLTAQELEVALLVSRGATNREAAAALFLSPKTIEAHLSRMYRKLDVRSRTELASAMASGDLAA